MNELSWEKVKTKHQYSGDEIISTLQKSIRRGNEELATYCCYEMMVSGFSFEEKLWHRLLVISVEDIGFANPNLINIIHVLHKNYELLKGKEDRYLQVLMATLLLVRSAKSRYVDELYNNLKAKIEKEDYRITIPDYAVDVHTKKGKKLKRSFLHFWQEASLLKNDVSKKEKRHFNEIIKRLNKTRNDI